MLRLFDTLASIIAFVKSREYVRCLDLLNSTLLVIAAQRLKSSGSLLRASWSVVMLDADVGPTVKQTKLRVLLPVLLERLPHPMSNVRHPPSNLTRWIHEAMAYLMVAFWHEDEGVDSFHAHALQRFEDAVMRGLGETDNIAEVAHTLYGVLCRIQ